MKTCTRCQLTKPFAEFGKQKLGKDGLSSWCRACAREYSAAERRAQGIKPRVSVRTTVEKLCHKCRTWKPFDMFSKDVRTKGGHTASCKSCQREYKAAYRSTTSAAEVRRSRRNYRYHNDITFKLADRVRSRIRQALTKTKKSTVSLELLGCTLDEFRRHIEALWLPGMTWENYSVHGWHIDHKVPCAKFDLADPVQQRCCFHYTNLQPLWAADNWSKGAKLS